jgi:hypothetical protein
MIRVCFYDEFKPGEDVRFVSMLTVELRSAFPGFIVRVVESKEHCEPFVVRVHGNWTDVDSEVIVAKAGEIIERVLKEGDWTRASQQEEGADLKGLPWPHKLPAESQYHQPVERNPPSENLNEVSQET